MCGGGGGAGGVGGGGGMGKMAGAGACGAAGGGAGGQCGCGQANSRDAQQFAKKSGATELSEQMAKLEAMKRNAEFM